MTLLSVAKGAAGLGAGVVGGAALGYGSNMAGDALVGAFGYGAGAEGADGGSTMQNWKGKAENAFNSVVGFSAEHFGTPGGDSASGPEGGDTGNSGAGAAPAADSGGATYQTEFGTVTVGADGTMAFGDASASSPAPDAAAGAEPMSRSADNPSPSADIASPAAPEIDMQATETPVTSDSLVQTDNGTQSESATGTATTDEAPAEPYQIPPFDDSPHPNLDGNQIDTIAVLQRHSDILPLKIADIQAKIDDPATPEDLRSALQSVADDPTLSLMLDVADKGGKGDGVMAKCDLDKIGSWPEIQQYNNDKAQVYAMAYVPSDISDKDKETVEPHPITANDAAREMYLYSDSLPKDINVESLQKIVDGGSRNGKTPPQLIASAKFLIDNPAALSAMTGGKKSVSRGELLDQISKTLYLTPDETAAVQTMSANRDVFFQKTMKRADFQKIVDDPNSSPEVKAAAQKMIDDPVLFGMIDNAKHGHKPSQGNGVDDGKVGAADFDRFVENLQTTGKTAPPPEKTPPMNPATANIALQDMLDGAKDDPAQKKKKGGEGPFGGVKSAFNWVVKHWIKPVFEPILKVAIKIGQYASIVCGFLELIPIPVISQIFGAMSIAAGAGAATGKLAVAGLDHKNMKEAAKEFGIDMAITVAGAVAPGVGAAAAKGAMKGAKAVKAGMSAEKAGVKATTAGEKTAKAGVSVEKAGVSAETAAASAKTAIKNDLPIPYKGTTADMGKLTSREEVDAAIKQWKASGMSDSELSQMSTDLNAYLKGTKTDVHLNGKMEVMTAQVFNKRYEKFFSPELAIESTAGTARKSAARLRQGLQDSMSAEMKAGKAVGQDASSGVTASTSEAAVKVEKPATTATSEPQVAVKPKETTEGQPTTSTEGDDSEWVEEVGAQVASSTVDVSVQTS